MWIPAGQRRPLECRSGRKCNRWLLSAGGYILIVRISWLHHLLCEETIIESIYNNENNLMVGLGRVAKMKLSAIVCEKTHANLTKAAPILKSPEPLTSTRMVDSLTAIRRNTKRLVSYFVSGRPRWRGQRGHLIVDHLVYNSAGFMWKRRVQDWELQESGASVRLGARIWDSMEDGSCDAWHRHERELSWIEESCWKCWIKDGSIKDDSEFSCLKTTILAKKRWTTPVRMLWNSRGSDLMISQNGLLPV